MPGDTMQYATRPALGEHKAMHLDEAARLKDAERFSRTKQDQLALRVASAIGGLRRSLAALERKGAVPDKLTGEG